MIETIKDNPRTYDIVTSGIKQYTNLINQLLISLLSNK